MQYSLNVFVRYISRNNYQLPVPLFAFPPESPIKPPPFPPPEPEPKKQAPPPPPATTNLEEISPEINLISVEPPPAAPL